MDKLNVSLKPYPQESNPLKEKIGVQSPEVDKPVNYVFGKILLVRSSEDFSRFRGTGFGCVTLDGDQTTDKGKRL